MLLLTYISISSTTKMTKQSNGKILKKKHALSVGCPYVRSKSTLHQTQGQVVVNRELNVLQVNQ